MRVTIYILSFAVFFSCLRGRAQTFTLAADTVYGNAFQCITPAKAWRGAGSYGLLHNTVSYTGSQRVLQWHVVASDFPNGWLPAVAVEDTGFHPNTALPLWNGTTGDTQSVYYPPGGGTFDLYVFETGLDTAGTYWIQIHIWDPASSYSADMWFVVANDATVLGDSIAGYPQVCPSGITLLTDTLYPNGTWSASNANIVLADSFATGISTGLDTISYTTAVVVYSGSDSCVFNPTVSRVITVLPTPLPSITNIGNTLYAPTVYTSYQWLYATTPIPGANSSSYTMLVNGTFAVTVTDTNTCVGTSFLFYEEYMGVPMVIPAAGAVNVFPNPATSVINITAPGPVDVRLTAMDGNLLIDRKNVGSVDISTFPDGAYLLSISDHGSGALLKTEKITKVGN